MTLNIVTALEKHSHLDTDIIINLNTDRIEAEEENKNNLT